MKKISLVISVYNEEKVIKKFYYKTSNILKQNKLKYEIIFVNDGSIDNSFKILKEITCIDHNAKIINFSKNFGHEAAMIAGIDYSSGDAIICMDADLQHPPELIPSIIEKLETGYDVINMVRMKNKDAGVIKKITSNSFYKIINSLSTVKLEKNASDFFGINRKVANILKEKYREKARFIRGYIQSVGFRIGTIEYEAQKRYAGESKYTIKKLFDFSINALVTFTNVPLKLGLYAGSVSIGSGMGIIIHAIYKKIVYKNKLSDNSKILTIISFMFAMQFIINGIIGQYVGILFNEIKDRPIYIVQDLINFQ